MSTKTKKALKKPAKKKAVASKSNVAPEQKTHWPVHPIALLFPRKSPEERAELKKDMRERVEKGLDALEVPLLLYEEKLADGRHRDELWMELAAENACDGYFRRKRPPTEILSPEKHGNLAAWMRAKSRNLVVRQTPADQRAAIFLGAVESYPELQAILEGIKKENLQRRQEGRPLAAGDQRGNTAKQVAGLAGVGATTVKQVQRLQKNSPEKFREVAEGKTTVKKALKTVKKPAQESKERNGNANNSAEAVKGERPKVADLVGIVHRGLAKAEEAEALALKSNAVLFKYNGYRIKVTCKIV